jgi:hypothetical protein
VPQGVPRYFTSLLRKLGYQVKLHLEPSSNITAEMRRHFQISVDRDWLPDYPRALVVPPSILLM